VEGVTIIESSSNMSQGDPLEGHLFALAHYRALLKTIAWTSNYIFLSLVNSTHIMRPMSEITCTFDHLSTQLALVRLKVKMSKCKLWSPLGIFPCIKILQGCTLVTSGLCILGVPLASEDFVTHFLDEVLSQDMPHIDDFPLLGDTQVALGILLGKNVVKGTNWTSLRIAIIKIFLCY
jgi:hypothetical protein